MDELKEKLKLAECPWNWGLNEIKDRKSATFIIDRLLEKEEEISEPWVHVCINLTIAYLHSENGNITKTITVLKECESILNSSTDNLIVKYKPAFLNVYYASRASSLILSSTPSEVKMFLDKVVRVEDFDIPNQAAVHAIKANVFLEFGVSGSTIALQHAKEALKKNSKEADWHFLMGKLLSRLRHFTQDHDISAAEISHLQTAYNLAGTPRSAIFLANAYIEKSRNLHSEAYKNRGHPDNAVRNRTKELTAEAKKLIKISLDKNQNQCVHILIRCAYAYTKLPRFDREYDTAKQLLEESLKRSPCNPMANKLAGDLCLQEEKPMYHKALKHFEIAASRNVFSANFAAFEIQLKLSLNPDVEAFYAKILEQFTENNYQMLTFIHATEYYLFIRRDLCMAINYFMKAVGLDPNFHALTDRWVKCVMKNVNLYELISNEVRFSINSQMFHDTNQLNLLKNALKKISEINPKLMEVPVVPNKVQAYLDTYERESKNVSGRGRGRGQGRGYGRGAGRGGRGRGGQSQSERTTNYNSQNRGRGRTNSGERRGAGSRNRSSSRNRVGQKNENEILNGKENYNNHQSNFDQSQFNRISYANDKRAEVLENPYFVKFLELQYKKMTKCKSFKEWLQEYEEVPLNVKSDKGSKKKKSDENSDTKFQEPGNSNAKLQEPGNSNAKLQEPGNSDAKFQELISIINELKEEINEIKLSETRSCCSSAHYRRESCHSLKSLQYNEFEKSRRMEEYCSDRNDDRRRKHRPDYYDKHMDPRDRYYRSHRLEDKHRWRSEDRNAKYNRTLPPRGEEDRYNINRGYYVSPERGIHRRPYNDSDSNSDNESRYHLSHDHRTERRSRKGSFLDRKMVRNSSRHSSPTYSDKKHLMSSHRHRSDDRRGRTEYMQHKGYSSSNSSETDSQFYLNQKEEKQRRRGSADSEYLRYRRSSVSETEKEGKHSKHKIENQLIGRRSNEAKLKKDNKSVKKEIPSPPSSRSSTDEETVMRKGGDDQDSDREPCLGYGKTKHPNIRKEDLDRRSYKEHHDCSSSDSVPDEKSVSKKPYLKSTESVKKDGRYDHCLDESSECGLKKKNRDVYSEDHTDKYSSGNHKYRNAGSKDNKKHDERFERVNKVDVKKNISDPSNLERISSYNDHGSDEASKMSRKSRVTDKTYKEHRRDEASKMVKKGHNFDKSERKSSNVKDNDYSRFDSSTNQPSTSRKGASVSRSSSEWENISHQETNRSDRENRCSRPLSPDEYEKTSSG